MGLGVRKWRKVSKWEEPLRRRDDVGRSGRKEGRERRATVSLSQWMETGG